MIIASLATVVMSGSALASVPIIEVGPNPVNGIYNNIETASITNYANRNGRNTVSIADIQAIANKSAGASFDDMLKKAEAERQRAKSVAGEWNTVSKLIKAAKKDHKAGKKAAAMKKLQTAIDHARIGYDQALGQRGAGPRF